MTSDGLTVSERASMFGLHFNAQLELERREPWVAQWSAWFGAGLDHLRAWLAAGRPSADRAALCVVGDPEIVAAVRAVVARLPECVAQFLVGNVVVVCGGVSTKGWCGLMPILPCAVPQLVVATVVDPGVLAHEFGHAVHRRPWPPTANLTAQQWETVQACSAALTVEAGRVDEMVERTLLRELAADALATAWGFPVDTTSGERGAGRRQRMMLDIQRRAASAPHDDDELE